MNHRKLMSRGEPLIDPDRYMIVGTKPFKLKDRPENRRIQMIDLRNFGEIPKLIAVEKVLGEHDKFVLRGFIVKPKFRKKEGD